MARNRGENSEAGHGSGDGSRIVATMVGTELIGDSAGVASVREQVLRLVRRQSDSRRPPPVLILGETGTGKGVTARLIQRLGPRRDAPFVDVNCAAIPETLLEAELFGFERGAFTDARQAKPGLFQVAHRGSIVLDEVGLLPVELQPKLLKVLEDGELRRLGATRSETVDVAVIAATSEPLEGAMRKGRFLAALYHRLSVLTLTLPPLRDRGGDIVRLAEYFLGRACADHRLPPKTIGSEAQQALLRYRWPGNVRELANLMERVALLGDGDDVTAAMLGLPEADRAPSTRRGAGDRPDEAVALRHVVGDVEREHLLAALRETGWNVTHAATRLDMPSNTLRYRMKKHGLQPEAGTTRPDRPREPRLRVEPPPPAPLRWEARHLALLRASLTTSGEDASTSVSRALEEVVDKIHSFGGRIEDLGPRAVVAVFGLEPTEDAARRAAHAALAIQKKVARARVEERRPWEATMAVHAGTFLVGAGATPTIDVDAKRVALAVLEDLVQRAAPDTIVASAQAATFLERRFELTFAGGAETPASVWRLLGGDSGLAARARLTPFVGRDDELRVLRHRLTLATEGHGQVVGIVGDAGIGKSRLLLQFRRSGDAAFVEGHCYSYTTAHPYVPVLEILRQACGIGEGDDHVRVRAAVRAVLKRVGADPERDAVYLLHLLGLPETAAQLGDVGPGVLKARTFEALQQLCFGGGKPPVILAVEDLHWIDRASEEFLNVLVERLPAVPALIVVTYRPGYRPSWSDRSYATQIALPPLSGSESRLMLEATLGHGAVLHALALAILQRAEGNPFFLEEMAQSVGTELAATTAVEVPDTVQSVLRARLDRLAPEERRLVQCAAVIGKDVQLSLLQAIADEREDTLHRSLGELQSTEFLYETRLLPEREYTFKHALTHEVAYGSLLHDRRRALHARIVEAIERLYADRLSEQVERLAHHAVRGEVWDKALRYLREAGTKALMRSANAEAIAFFTQGLDLVQRLPATRERLRQEMELLLALGQAHQAAKGLAAAEAEKAYSRARDLAERVGERTELFRALWGLWLYTSWRGRLGASRRIAEELLALAERQGDPALLLEGHHPMWATMLWLGEFEAARRHFGQGMALYDREQHQSHAVLYGGHDPGVCCRMMSGLTLWILGCPTGAVESGQAAIALARELSHPHSVALAMHWVGMIHQLRRDVETTRQLAESVVALSAEHGFQQWLLAGQILDGWVQAVEGRGAAGIAQVRQGIGEYRAMGSELFVPYFLSLLAGAHLKHGEADEGLSAAVEALTVAAATEERSWDAELYRLKGELLLVRDPANESEAEIAFRQAVEIAGRQRATSWELRAVTSLSGLLARQGKRYEARRLLSDTYGRFTEGFDTADLQQAKTLLDELAAP
jgi:DNA-binding NtrC family response regulator/predicted ATPase